MALAKTSGSEQPFLDSLKNDSPEVFNAVCGALRGRAKGYHHKDGHNNNDTPHENIRHFVIQSKDDIESLGHRFGMEVNRIVDSEIFVVSSRDPENSEQLEAELNPQDGFISLTHETILDYANQFTHPRRTFEPLSPDDYIDFGTLDKA